VPDAPINFAEDTSVRTSTTNGLTWDDGVNNGGVAIIDYRINMREQGASLYSAVITGLTTKSYTVSGLTLGVTYEFTVEARNSIGFGAPSTIVTILQAMPPL
jgi:hypothetical protein